MLRSTELPETLAPGIRETEYICKSFLAGLSFIVMDTGRDANYINNHLLSYTAQDYLQSAISLPLLVQEGIQNVCRRELRFILEMSIKLCYVQQKDYSSPIADKVASFKKTLESTNISIQKKVALGMISESERSGFYQEVGRLYGETSGYVHWTPKQILETIAAVDQGRSSGHESAESIRQLNTLISRGLACSLVFLYHAGSGHSGHSRLFLEKSLSSVAEVFEQLIRRKLLDRQFMHPDNAVMPRTLRASVGGYCYHVLNCGNERARIFHDANDSHVFVASLREACTRIPMRLIGYCLMPNHFHLVLWPHEDGDLSIWMQWLLTTQAHGYRMRYRGSGHVWQGRFKAFPIEEDGHLLVVLRYVERNSLRAGLVTNAEDWQWCSLPVWLKPPLMPWLDQGPVPRHAGWLEYVQAPQTDAELAALRRSVERGAPYGSSAWVERTAEQLGLESSLRSPGRPRGRMGVEFQEGGLFRENEP